jgi:hypothetical protein
VENQHNLYWVVNSITEDINFPKDSNFKGMWCKIQAFHTSLFTNAFPQQTWDLYSGENVDCVFRL